MHEDGTTYERPVIITADDHRMTRHMIRSILEQEGMEVLGAKNGREALDIFVAQRPDLIISDIFMPVMDGLELCTRVKEHSQGKHVPVLIFTAHNQGTEVDTAFQAGASDFISKPLNPSELKHRVRRLLYLRALEIKREAAEIELQSSFDTIQHLSRRVLHAYEEERARLARELHDELGMTLTTLKLNLQLLSKDIPADLSEKMASVLELVNKALAATRSEAYLMRPPSLDLGLVSVIENMLKELKRSSGMETSLRVSGEYPGLPVEVETALYRCVQEAITNAARHSSAERVFVYLAFHPREVTVRVKDDGVGFTNDKSFKGHLGLQGMKERVALLSGDFRLETTRGKGTEIIIRIPLTDGQEEMIT